MNHSCTRYTTECGSVQIIDGPLSRSNKVKVIAAKGEMAKHPQLEALPDLGSDPTMGQFPDLSITDLRQLQLAVHAPQPRNSVLVGTARPLLSCPLLLPFLSSLGTVQQRLCPV